MSGTFVEGDRIEAFVKPDGVAWSISGLNSSKVSQVWSERQETRFYRSNAGKGLVPSAASIFAGRPSR